VSACPERDRLQPLYRRLKKLKSRVRVLRWELRQRAHAKGAWYRVGRVLAGAEAVYAIPQDVAAALEADGATPDPVGFELEPPLRLYWLDVGAIEQITGRRQLPVRLSSELLQAGALALVPFAPTPG
jgi:hypothetical protein